MSNRLNLTLKALVNCCIIICFLYQNPITMFIMKNSSFFYAGKNPFACRISATILLMLILGIYPLALKSQSEWTAPETADAYNNSYKGNASATTAGKKLYMQFCAICHGNKGKGDGLAGMSLKPRPANFTKEDIQKQSDGAIYWKITEGKPPMAAYKTVLTEEQRWQLVNYIRALAKKKK